MDLNLKSKVAMVAGASRGLGFGVAKVLAAEGAKVSIASRNADAIQAAAAKIREQTGVTVFHVVADVRSAVDIERWCSATAHEHGGVDLLFANSGGPPAGGFLNLDDKAWQEAFELLVLSVVRLVRVVVPSMKVRGGGSVVLSTSSSVKEPITNLTLSNVLRASVSALAKNLSIELAGDRIRVNHAVPGRFDTDRVRELDTLRAQQEGISVAQQKERTTAVIPLHRYGDAEEYARAVAFLLSDAASYITGATLQVDGGMIRSVF